MKASNVQVATRNVTLHVREIFGLGLDIVMEHASPEAFLVDMALHAETRTR
jgi:hypothetical protein